MTLVPYKVACLSAQVRPAPLTQCQSVYITRKSDLRLGFYVCLKSSWNCWCFKRFKNISCCLYWFDDFFQHFYFSQKSKQRNEFSFTLVKNSGWTRKLCTWNKNQNAKAKGYNRKTQNCVEPSFPPSRHAPI